MMPIAPLIGAPIPDPLAPPPAAAARDSGISRSAGARQGAAVAGVTRASVMGCGQVIPGRPP